MENNKVFRIYADPGYCFTNKKETIIYYDVAWVTEEDVKTNVFHQITLERAEEIKKAYRDKYGIK